MPVRPRPRRIGALLEASYYSVCPANTSIRVMLSFSACLAENPGVLKIETQRRETGVEFVIFLVPSACPFPDPSPCPSRSLSLPFQIPLPVQGEGKRRGGCVFFATAVTRG